jgi:hypothetical protein
MNPARTFIEIFGNVTMADFDVAFMYDIIVSKFFDNSVHSALDSSESQSIRLERAGDIPAASPRNL